MLQTLLYVHIALLPAPTRAHHALHYSVLFPSYDTVFQLTGGGNNVNRHGIKTGTKI